VQHTRNDVTVLGPENAGQPVMTRVVGGDASAAGRKRAEPEAEAGADEEEGEQRDGNSVKEGVRMRCMGAADFAG
jgi:hypothetical protein